MDYEKAYSIFGDIQKTELTDLLDSLYGSAVRYARIRADWRLSTLDERKRVDSSRTIAHNAFIDACNILSRNMAKAGEDVSWRVELGEDRKNIGDFACYLHCILGIEAR